MKVLFKLKSAIKEGEIAEMPIIWTGDDVPLTLVLEIINYVQMALWPV